MTDSVLCEFQRALQFYFGRRHILKLVNMRSPRLTSKKSNAPPATRRALGMTSCCNILVAIVGVAGCAGVPKPPMSAAAQSAPTTQLASAAESAKEDRMTDSVLRDRTDLPDDYAGPVVLVNVFTPKAGKLDEFIAAQTNEYRRLLGKIAGWRGNRLHRSLDGKTAVNYAVFESLSTYRAWRGSDLFAEHLKVIRPLLERTEPGLYAAALYEAGSL